MECGGSRRCVVSFVGHSSVSIDQKRRIAIPAKYREELAQCCGNRLVCTIGKSSTFFLRLFPRPEWDELEKGMNPQLIDSSEDDPVARFLQAMAEDVYVDSNHRLLLPQHLVDRVGLQKRAVLTGRGSYFEIWTEEDWQSELAAGLELFSNRKQSKQLD